MKDKQSLHLKVQELCDCYSTTDPLKEMTKLVKDEDQNEAALKWIALAVLHGINANAKKISLSRSEGGKVKVVAEYRETELPDPGDGIGQKVIESLRGITHLDEEKGKTPLVVGVRDGSVELKVRLTKKDNAASISMEFRE